MATIIIIKWPESFFHHCSKQFLIMLYKNSCILIVFVITALSHYDLTVFAGLHIFYKKRNSQVRFCLHWRGNSTESWVIDSVTSAQYCTVTLNDSIRRPVLLWGLRLRSHGVYSIACIWLLKKHNEGMWLQWNASFFCLLEKQTFITDGQ